MVDADLSGPGGSTRAKEDSAASLLQVSGLCKGFTDKDSTIEILRDLSLQLHSGQTMAVVGESGVGKSTLLHILGALEPPDRGRVLYNGRDVFGMSNAQIAAFRNARIGFVFQFHYLLSGFTSIENVMMPGLIAGMHKKEIRRKAEAILVRVGLQDRLKHRVSDLSGGEQQRVALSRALVLNPDILLADEPTGNLDQKNSGQVHEFLVELNREMEMAMIVVTHSATLADMMQRKMSIVEGRLEQIK
jgi:lipoprotein-releasing system ATP-binding protein